MPHRQHTFNPYVEATQNREPEFTPNTKVSGNAKAAWAAAVALVFAGASAALIYSSLVERIKTAQTTADTGAKDIAQIKVDVQAVAADVKTLLRKTP